MKSDHSLTYDTLPAVCNPSQNERRGNTQKKGLSAKMKAKVAAAAKKE